MKQSYESLSGERVPRHLARRFEYHRFIRRLLFVTAVLAGCTTPSTSAVEQTGLVEAGIALDGVVVAPMDLAFPIDGGLAFDMAFPIDAVSSTDAPTAIDAPVADAPLMDAPPSDGSTGDGGVNDGGVNDGGVNDGGVNDGGVNDGGVGDGGTGLDDGGFPSRDALDPQVREVESFYACAECSAGGNPLTALGPGLLVLGLVLRRRRPR